MSSPPLRSDDAFTPEEWAEIDRESEESRERPEVEGSRKPVTVETVADFLADRSLGLPRDDADQVQAAIDAAPVLRAEADRIRARLAVLARPRVARTAHRRDALRRLIVGVAAVGVVYGALAVVSSQTTTDRERLANLGALPSSVRLGDAVTDIAEARRSMLGLFPQYDAAALNVAADRLAGIAGAGGETAPEAQIALARVRLYQNRDTEALSPLIALVRSGGVRAPEARRLLDFARTQDDG